jgi:hypothetical protein
VRYLIGDHTQSKGMLKLSNAPRSTGNDFLMACSDQKEVRHYRNAKGVLNSAFIATDLVLTHPQATLEFSIDLLHLPDIMPPKLDTFTTSISACNREN